MIIKLFSKRREDAEISGSPDVYQYTEVPKTLRVQVQQILTDAVGPQYWPSDYDEQKYNPEAWKLIHKAYCREKGVHSLGNSELYRENVLTYLGSCSIDDFLDLTELFVRYIHRVLKMDEDYERKKLGISQNPDDAIDELNYRFREAKLGFQFEDGEIIKIDSEYIHDQVVKPALRILNRAGYTGARQEFLQAREHYINREFEQTIVYAAKAFESAIKTICESRSWDFPKSARASDLLKIVRAHGLWPDYLDGSFDQLLATLTSGLPKVRNDTAAHGSGSAVRHTPDYVASYALHLVAAKIVLMADADAAL